MKSVTAFPLSVLEERICTITHGSPKRACTRNFFSIKVEEADLPLCEIKMLSFDQLHLILLFGFQEYLRLN